MKKNDKMKCLLWKYMRNFPSAALIGLVYSNHRITDKEKLSLPFIPRDIQIKSAPVYSTLVYYVLTHTGVHRCNPLQSDTHLLPFKLHHILVSALCPSSRVSWIYIGELSKVNSWWNHEVISKVWSLCIRNINMLVRVAFIAWSLFLEKQMELLYLIYILVTHIRSLHGAKIGMVEKA